MQLSPKLKIFPQLFFEFLKSKSNFEHSKQKDEPHNWRISEIRDRKKRGYLYG